MTSHISLSLQKCSQSYYCWSILSETNANTRTCKKQGPVCSFWDFCGPKSSCSFRNKNRIFVPSITGLRTGFLDWMRDFLPMFWSNLDKLLGSQHPLVKLWEDHWRNRHYQMVLSGLVNWCHSEHDFYFLSLFFTITLLSSSSFGCSQ